MDRGINSPLISIIIPHHGGQKILQDCLNSLESTDYSNLEILVLDNKSPDDSIKNIQPKFSNVQFLFVKGRPEASRLIQRIFVCGGMHKEIDLQLAYDMKLL